MFGLVLTTAGAAEIEAAYQAGTVVSIVSADIGDGDGAAIDTDPDILAAATEVAGAFGNLVFSDSEQDEGLISGQIVIDCKQYPGKVLRAVGLRSSSGTLIAYGGYPDTYLPAQTDSIIKEVILTFVLTLTHSESVELTLDPDRQILTRTIADDLYLNESENLADVPDKAQARTNLEIYSKEEGDARYQPAGDYASEGDSYTKNESDLKFQVKGNYAISGSSYTKAESDAKYPLKTASYTTAQSDARYIQNVMRGARVSLTMDGTEVEAPEGCVLTGGNGNEATQVGIAFYRPLQILINGTYRTITG